MTTDLVDRYVDATVRTLPPDTQDDVRAELTASITDAIDARIESGEDPAQAERTVLTGMGDPARLTADYADRPLHLIGPRYYLTWWRLLKLLLIIVPPVAFVGVALGQAIAGAPIGTLIGESIGVAFATVVHVGFWVTLVFAVLERTATDPGAEWDLDQLAESQQTGSPRSDAIASVVFAVLAIAAILWDQLRGFVLTADGEALPVLHPGLWGVPILLLLTLIVLEAALALAITIRGRWSTTFAILNTALAVSVLSWVLTMFGRGRLLNPEVLDMVFRDNGVTEDTMRVLGVLLVFGVLLVTAWDVIDGWIRARRDARR